MCARPELKPIEKETKVVLRFPEVEKLNSSVLQLDEVQFEYTPGNPIFTSVNLSAAMDSRICIVSVAVNHDLLLFLCYCSLCCGECIHVSLSPDVGR